MTDRWPLRDEETYRVEILEQVGEGLSERLASVRLLVLDCDGILTDGSLLYGPDGEALKAFDARDGLGLMMLRSAGIARAVLTGRRSEMVARRCTDLKFEAIKMGRFDKVAALAEIWRETGQDAEHTLYMGDDILDLPALAAAALPVTVPGAPAEVREFCALETQAGGGRGAVREVCDLLLKARGEYVAAIQRLAASGAPADDPEVTQ
jgi:3-deoxy-D-manno-octulosonate 8-phosphate phosphatase (KDO 8-P phosphatase)